MLLLRSDRLIKLAGGCEGHNLVVLHVHAGFLVKVASEAAYQMDIGPGDVLYWFTDMGWIMGPFSLVGAHANGATMVLYEGAPDYPDPDPCGHRLRSTGSPSSASRRP